MRLTPPNAGDASGTTDLAAVRYALVDRVLSVAVPCVQRPPGAPGSEPGYRLHDQLRCSPVTWRQPTSLGLARLAAK
jgi:hypothetical protein